MPYSYTTFVPALASVLEVDPADADFVAQLPQIIDDAEQRIYRELDLLVSIITVTSALTANSRFFTLPVTSGGGTVHFLVVDAVNVFDAASTRHPLTPATREGIDFLWPSETAASAASIPGLFARISDTQLLVGSAPGAAWACEVIGTIRPAPLSASNPNTYLSNYLSDLFFAGCMVSATGGLLKNYGAQSDSAPQGLSWEGQFQQRLASARKEELRKSFVSAMSAPPTSAQDA
jgi:hypothetical protein